jgi:hypothetical protein
MCRNINTYTILVGRPQVERSFGSPRRGEENNIKMDLTEIGWETTEWNYLAWDKNNSQAVVNAVINLEVL